MQLAKFLADAKLSATAFARKIGVKQPTVHRYLNDTRFPDPVMIEKIAAATNGKVTVKDWYEQAAAARARKAAEAGQGAAA